MNRGSRIAPHSFQAVRFQELTELLIDESHLFPHQLQLLPQELLAEGREEPRPTLPAHSPGPHCLPRTHRPSTTATDCSHHPSSCQGIRLYPPPETLLATSKSVHSPSCSPRLCPQLHPLTFPSTFSFLPGSSQHCILRLIFTLQPLRSLTC